MLKFLKMPLTRTLLIGLSKAFSCLYHELLIAKLHGLYMSFLNLLQEYYSSNRKQRNKGGSFFSSWEDVLPGVPQSYIMGLLLLNIFMCDMFLILNTVYFTGYADDNTPLQSQIVSKM